MKRASHRGSRSNFYYWRDKTGHEIDLLVGNGQEMLHPEGGLQQPVAAVGGRVLKKQDSGRA